MIKCNIHPQHSDFAATHTPASGVKLVKVKEKLKFEQVKRSKILKE